MPFGINLATDPRFQPLRQLPNTPGLALPTINPATGKPWTLQEAANAPASARTATYDPTQAETLTAQGSGGSGGGWFTQNQPQQGGSTPGGTAAGGSAPSYVNMSDPVQAFVWQGFQQKGVTPRDQGDFQYWVDAVNKTGGITDAGNKGYWTNRFQQQQGGIGDYGQGSGGGGNGGLGDPLSTLQNTPGYQFALQQGLRGVQSSAAAKGTLLTGGTLKALQGYGTGLADQTYQSSVRNALDFSRLGLDAANQSAS